MDILSFILGIALVVVIGLSVVAVISFVKVRKIEKEIEHLILDIFQKLERDLSVTHQRIDELENNIFSQMDSRLDRLENKLTIKK